MGEIPRTDPDDRLAGIALFAEIGPAVRQALASGSVWRTYRSHQEIIGKESSSRDVYFVVAGRVRVVNWSYAGREVSFEDIPAGGSFGELAAIDGAPRSATVIALEETPVARIAPEVFMQAVLNHPPTARRLMERLAAVIRRSTERIFDLSVHGATIRIYADLLARAEAGRRPDNSAIVSPIPIHADIAARVSTTRETVARVMGDLSRRSLVVREKDALIVRDLDRLAELVAE